MITLTLRWMGRFKEIEFPCTDTELQAKLADLRPPDASPDEIFVLAVNEPTALSLLEDQFLDMDEINFLAKRMESFDYDELLQFYAAAQYEGFHYPKDLINLTFNLPRYTVIHDLRNTEAVGKAHYMNTHGCMTQDEQKRIDFAAIGRELIRSGNGKATEFGLLFKNEDIPFQEVYNGVNFPEYYYEHSLVTATINFEGRTEYLYLPCDDLAITKAMYRVGAVNVDELNIQLEDMNMNSPAWFDRLKQILRDGSIYDVNQVVEAIDTADMDLAKLTAVMEYTGRTDVPVIVALAQNLDHFCYLPYGSDMEDVGRHFIDTVNEYYIHDDLEDYFDYDGFGEHMAELYDGKFVDSGFVCMDQDSYLENILADVQHEGIGGI